MGNVKFIHEGIEGSTLTASAGTAATSDINNLLSRNPLEVWKSGAVTNNQTLTVQLPAERSVDTVVLDGHNLSAVVIEDLDLAVEYSADGVSWTPVASKTADDIVSVLVFEFGSAAARYWRVRFSQVLHDFAAAPEVGNIFIGTRFETEIPYNNDLAHSEKYTTVTTRSLNGTPYSSQRLEDGIEGWKNMKWGNVDNAIVNSFYDLQRSVRGSLRPFYFIDTDLTIRLVTIVGDTIPVTYKRYNINDVQLELQAFLPNTIGSKIIVEDVDISQIIMS